jgi:SAM-dependent methyltransferase
MKDSDGENLAFAGDVAAVDELNGRFYRKFPYPWPPSVFERVAECALEARLLNQSIGCWDSQDIPPEANIWVAGCGTNQAVFTALKYPKATITATDLSSASLQLASVSARQLGLDNIVFEQRSINDCAARDQFDYILCTGVIHHNAEPEVPLRKLAQALRPTGVCELMVYNRYHRVLTTAFQKAVQILAESRIATDFDREMGVARAVLRARLGGHMGAFCASVRDQPEAVIADSCMQPVEYSYTVESLENLVVGCGLRILAPCVSQYNRAGNDFLWHVHFDDPQLREAYEALPDLRRWQVGNLLLLENSPLLWFYVQRQDSPRPVKPERSLCEEFLDRDFVPVRTHRRLYVRSGDRGYIQDDRQHPYPAPHTDPSCASLLAAVDHSPGIDMRSLLKQLGLSFALADVNRIRLMLTTCAYPYLVRPAGVGLG